MRIGIDILGGDYAPEATVGGCILAVRDLPAGARLVLIGDENSIRSICQRQNFDHSVFDIVHTSDFIEMGEHPAKAFVQKPNSSVVLGFKLLAKGDIQGF